MLTLLHSSIVDCPFSTRHNKLQVNAISQNTTSEPNHD
jgi:hypothetical protein